MNSPLEQFSIVSYISLRLGVLDISLTNVGIFCVLTYGCIHILWYYLFGINGGKLVPGRCQVIAEMMFSFVKALAHEQIVPSNHYIGIIFTTWLYILTSNLLGLVPLSFATTSQLVLAFGLSFSLFIGVTLIGVLKHGVHFMSFFLPSGAPLGLSPLLVVIEVISYVFRPISLGVRLFANITAGHSLLVIIAGFSSSMLSAFNMLSWLGFVPAAVVVIIFGLELAVAVLQAYVFIVLFCIYLKDALELH